jgi:hypothetical protein
MGLRVCAFLYRIGAVLVNSVHCTRASVSIQKFFSPTVCDHRRSLYRFYQDTLRTATDRSAPAKNGILAPFIYKNEHFAKTGSGLT